jgi:hypothetical protein
LRTTTAMASRCSRSCGSTECRSSTSTFLTRQRHLVGKPYIVDDGEMIGDSDTIIAHVIAKNDLKLDGALTAGQRDMNVLITRMLDDLY